MKKFKLTPRARAYFEFSRDAIYSEDCIDKNGRSVSDLALIFPKDWEEVPPKEKPELLHRDTDLGFFSAIMLTTGCEPGYAISKAKELIKLLNQESK